MKRSDMLLLLSGLLRNGNLGGTYKERADTILTFLEEVGMRPPVIYMTDIDPDWFGGDIHTEDWEEETCGFCKEPCGNDWCPTLEKE